MRNVKASRQIQTIPAAELVELINDRDALCIEQVEHLRQQVQWQRKRGEIILGGLWLKRSEESGYGHGARSLLALIGDHHFFRAELYSSEEDGNSVHVESVPMGRLRSVITHTTCTKNGEKRGTLMLDFAGHVLQSDGNQVFYEMESGWPGKEVTAFLDALHEARR